MSNNTQSLHMQSPPKSPFYHPASALQVAIDLFDACIQDAAGLMSLECGGVPDDPSTEGALNTVIQRVSTDYKSRHARLKARENKLEESVRMDAERARPNDIAGAKAREQVDAALLKVAKENEAALNEAFRAMRVFASELSMIKAERFASTQKLDERACATKSELLDRFVKARMSMRGNTSKRKEADMDAAQAHRIRMHDAEMKRALSSLDDATLSRATKAAEHARSMAVAGLDEHKRALKQVHSDIASVIRSLRIGDASGGVTRAAALFKAKAERARMNAIKALIVKVTTSSSLAGESEVAVA